MQSSLKTVRFKNFRCFANEQKLQIAKLTILTGANSSGKSSILYSILAPLQSKGFPFLFSPNGKYVSMGDFREISNKHDITKEFELGFEIVSTQGKNSETYLIDTSWRRNKTSDLPELSKLKVEGRYYKLSIKKAVRGFSLDFSYDPTKDEEATLMRAEDQVRLIKSVNDLLSRTETEIKKTGVTKSTNKVGRIEKYFETLYSTIDIKNAKLTLQEGSSGIKTNLKDNNRLEREIKKLVSLFYNFDRELTFISSFRLHPERTYLERSKTMIKVKTFGDGYLDQIVLWHRSDKKKFNELVSIMKKLKMVYSLKPHRIGGGRYEIMVSPNSNGIPSPLNDTGFGINQFLPIIVADLQLGDGSTLLVSQPEIHLHPSAQAEFGTYLSSQMESKGKNYFIETHSEYLLNRIRFEISKKKIRPEDVIIYHVENKGAETKIYPIKIDGKGNYIKAPKNFFDTYYQDIKNIALNSFND